MCSFRWNSSPLFCLAALLTAGRLGAGEPQVPGPPLVDEPIRQSMQDRDYPAAIAAIEQAAKAAGAPQDYLMYLQGRARMLHQEYPAAVETFEGLQKQFPHSPWVRRARLAAAVALAQSGDFRRAGQLYRAEAESLFSADRKQEMAEIYLEFAADLFAPADKDQAPNYQAAREFYLKALGMGLKPEPRAAAGVSGRSLPARVEIFRECGRRVRTVDQGPRGQPASHRSPLPPGRVPAGAGPTGIGPPRVAGPAGRTRRFQVRADRRRHVPALAHLERAPAGQRQGTQPGRRGPGKIPPAIRRSPAGQPGAPGCGLQLRRTAAGTRRRSAGCSPFWPTSGSPAPKRSPPPATCWANRTRLRGSTPKPLRPGGSTWPRTRHTRFGARFSGTSSRPKRCWRARRSGQNATTKPGGCSPSSWPSTRSMTASHTSSSCWDRCILRRSTGTKPSPSGGGSFRSTLSRTRYPRPGWPSPGRWRRN